MFTLYYLVFYAVVLLVVTIGLAWEKVKPLLRAYFERRAAARRDRAKAKCLASARKWGLVPWYPNDDLEIPRSTIDRAFRSRQYRVPTESNDVKGVTR